MERISYYNKNIKFNSWNFKVKNFLFYKCEVRKINSIQKWIPIEKINENQISAFLKNALKGIVYLQ